MSEMIRDHVTAQIQQKIAKGEALAHAQQVVHDIEEQARAAHANVAKATREALNNGWTENELRQLGLIPKKATAPRTHKRN